MEEVHVRRPRRFLLWSVLGLITIAAAVGGVLIARNANGNGGGKDKKEKDEDAIVAAPVELSPVVQGDISTWLQTTTTLEARNEATLVARAQGQVIELVADEGEWVQKGATLARLDDTEARLRMRRAEVAREVAQRESERAKQLIGQGFMSAKEMDDLDLKLKTAQVEVEEASYALSQTRLVAPFSGRVLDRMIKLGETVTAGRECFRMADFHPILARAYFPERDARRVRVGQAAELSMDSHAGKAIAARVSHVNPSVDRANGTIKVTLEVANPSGDLRPGSFARVRLRTGSHDAALLIPRRGVLSEDGESYVYVARGDSCVRVNVSVGAVENETAQIIAGLRIGDSVVTVGQGSLKPGARIKPVTL
jgi:membrane fusion protein (multidrug efflux system)